MKTTVDLQTLLGFFSATGLPVIIKTIITFVHPALYTLTCGQAYVSGVAPCYENERDEAILFLVLAAIAIAYGCVTLFHRLSAAPAPPPGTVSAVIPAGQVPVTIDQAGTTGLATAKANPGTVAGPVPIDPPKGP